MFWFSNSFQFSLGLSDRVATNPENTENLENPGDLKNCQDLKENSGKF